MSARRNFLRDITLAIAASLAPRILQPAVPEVSYDELLEQQVEVKFYYTKYPLTPDDCYTGEVETLTYWIPKKEARYYEWIQKNKQAT